MNILLWCLEIFLFLMCLVCIKAIMRPEAHARWTLSRTKREMKFYAFEGEIKITPKSIEIIRKGHTIMLAAIIIFMVVVGIFL